MVNPEKGSNHKRGHKSKRGQTIVWFILCCSDDFSEGAVVVLGLAR